MTTEVKLIQISVEIWTDLQYFIYIVISALFLYLLLEQANNSPPIT